MRMEITVPGENPRVRLRLTFSPHKMIVEVGGLNDNHLGNMTLDTRKWMVSASIPRAIQSGLAKGIIHFRDMFCANTTYLWTLTNLFDFISIAKKMIQIAPKKCLYCEQPKAFARIIRDFRTQIEPLTTSTSHSPWHSYPHNNVPLGDLQSALVCLKQPFPSVFQYEAASA